jgi:glycosyltransferase involved in cell wall biosynthesis
MKVSVCTTTARRGFVEQQAAMIAAQDVKSFNIGIEWVIVDFAYEERKELLKNIHENTGLSITHVPNVRDGQLFFRDITRNRNQALKYAKGDVIIFLDDYAIIRPDFVMQHVKLHRRGPCLTAGQMYRMEHVIEDPKLLVGLPFEHIISQYPDYVGYDHRAKRGDKFITEPYRAVGITYTGNLGISRPVIDIINGFDPRMESGLEDCDIGFRAYMAKFETYFVPNAATFNLYTGHIPYTFSFDHTHDVEPFISNEYNKFSGDVTLKENEHMTIEFLPNYRIATCKKCGAKGMVDPRELMKFKQENGLYRTPSGLPGGLDTLKGNKL